MAEDMHDLAQARQRQRTEHARVKMNAMRQIRNLAQDHDTAVYLIAELMVLVQGARLEEIADMGIEWQRQNDVTPHLPSPDITRFQREILGD